MGTIAVDFTTNLGDIVIDLNPTAAPLTVQNFLSYAENMTVGDGYEDSFFHRLVSGFVLQGGGYYYSTETGLGTIATGAPVVNEYNANDPNVEGTVAMAKVSTDPNSATDQFFINLADNSSNLDNQNGGFTVFGTVTAATWPVVEAIASQNVIDAYNTADPSTAAFGQLPIVGTIANSQISADNLVLVTNVTVTGVAPCYARGTHIWTTRGEVKIEQLRIGDQVITAPLRGSGGGRVSVAWVGHRRIHCRAHPKPEQVMPVRVAAGAFSDTVPHRDLLLSPDHAVFVEGALIPIKHLINARSIAQLDVAEIEYWHVELTHHDVILAEGLPAESYLDTGNRTAFANGGAFVQLHPDFAPLNWNKACAELVQDGPRLVTAKQFLFERAGCQDTRPALALQVLAAGQALRPKIVAPGAWRYALPAGTRALTLLSPRWVPAASQARSIDGRMLGVRLSAVAIDDEPAGLDSPLFASGFHPLETSAEGQCRWTNGCAQLALPPGARSVMLYVGDGVTPITGRRADPARRRRAG
jgi:cyclophilin family peptidyl-prolyl cis-trans isomerase